MNQVISINGRSIGSNYEPYLIAEIGLNHNGDVELAKKMVHAAKNSGAHAVKFQAFIAEELFRESDDAFPLFKSLELQRDQFAEIAGYCREIGVTFFATPFSLNAIDMLESLNVPCYKIASMDINYIELIQHAAKTGKPMLLSTGTASFGEIDKAVKAIEKVRNDQIIILHCVSKYPPRHSEVNIRRIKVLRTLFPYPIGFSDHSPDNTMAVGARIFGSVLFEKHFTIDKNLEGPDHALSLNPHDFQELKKRLMIIDAGLSANGKELTDATNSIMGRRSLYASRDLEKGTRITKDMIEVLRPGTGISPEYMPIFIERVLQKSLKKGEPFDLSCI